MDRLERAKNKIKIKKPSLSVRTEDRDFERLRGTFDKIEAEGREVVVGQSRQNHGVGQRGIQ